MTLILASNWMGDLYNKYPEFKNTHINRLLIPGSHDSGTSKMSGLARTQAWTINEQLDNGIRYFDIRPKVNESTFYVHHGETGPNGSADLGHYSTSLDPDSSSNDKYIFKQIRDFLKLHPHEILILKFQNYKAFGEQDYYDFINLIRCYFTFDTPSAKCKLVTLNHGTGAYINKETVGSLIDAGKRVFVVWDTEDVPTGSRSKAIWDHAFKFTPSLTQSPPYCLWDPYWHEDDDSLADDRTPTEFQRWWKWHEKNLNQWENNAASGFFVLQSQMQQLPAGDAKASAERNNEKNIKHYIEWVEKSNKPMNIMTFDFVNYGHLCHHIAKHYVDKFENAK
jgi:hypothetical protein